MAKAAFAAIADPTRRQILDLLATREYPAGELARRFPVSRPAISRHLRVLRRARLVKETRRGRQRVYSLRAAPLREVDTWLRRYEQFWREGLERLKTHLEEDHGDGRDRSRVEPGRE